MRLIVAGSPLRSQVLSLVEFASMASIMSHKLDCKGLPGAIQPPLKAMACSGLQQNGSQT